MRECVAETFLCLQCTLVEVKGLYVPEALIEIKAIARVA